MPTQAISPPLDTVTFGSTVAVDGARAIVEERNGVYIYEFSNNRWDLTADLLPDVMNPFIGSVALDGNTAAVQYMDNSLSSASIVLGVFEFSNDEWAQVAAFTLPSTANAINFTNPLAISGETIVIGVADPNGKVRVYEKIDNAWTLVTELTELDSPDVETEVNSEFASDLDVNDDTIVIRRTSFDIELNGTLFIYKKIDGNWIQVSRLPIIGENNLRFTKKLVSLSANRLIVAVRPGVVVFDLINGNWTEVGFFGPNDPSFDPDPDPNNTFASESITSVSLDSTGTQAALGSNRERVFLFQFVNGEWVESELGTNNNPRRFGESVAIDGEHLMAGSQGAVYYYRLNQTSPCIDTDGDGFGWNGTNTCTPTLSITVDNQPQVLQCIDTDGDGFGWNGVETCSPQGGEPGSVIDQSLSCIDTDGDGYGWNGVETCSPDEGEPGQAVDQSLICLDSDGDGFGWTGTQSCRFDEQGNIVIL